MSPKSSWRITLAVILNLLIAGVGHVTLGFWKRGLLWFFLSIALGLLFGYFLPEVTTPAVILRVSDAVALPLVPFSILMGVLSAIDAWRAAALYNAGLAERG